MFGFLCKVYLEIKGATAIEYGLIAGLISTAAILAFVALGGSVESIFSTISSQFSDAMPS